MAEGQGAGGPERPEGRSEGEKVHLRSEREDRGDAGEVGNGC